MLAKGEEPHEDAEAGPHRRPEASNDSDGSLCFSDAEDRSWHSWNDSNCAGSAYEDYLSPCASGHNVSGALELCRTSSVSDRSLEADLENGLSEIKASPEKIERNCRICHLCLEGSAPESGIPIVLGCSCKDDLAAAHMQCAETWFKIKGNKTCEICGATACNVVGTGEPEFIEQWNETNSTPAAALPQTAEGRRFWQGHRFLNFLLACMVFAFIISWLFRFNAPG